MPAQQRQPVAVIGAPLDLQHVAVQKGEGEFTLLHAMAGPGYFHLVLTGVNVDATVNLLARVDSTKAIPNS